jgi:hypothetical protein
VPRAGSVRVECRLRIQPKSAPSSSIRAFAGATQSAGRNSWNDLPRVEEDGSRIHSRTCCTRTRCNSLFIYKVNVTSHAYRCVTVLYMEVYTKTSVAYWLNRSWAVLRTFKICLNLCWIVSGDVRGWFFETSKQRSCALRIRSSFSTNPIATFCKNPSYEDGIWRNTCFAKEEQLLSWLQS